MELPLIFLNVNQPQKKRQNPEDMNPLSINKAYHAEFPFVYKKFNADLLKDEKNEHNTQIVSFLHVFGRSIYAVAHFLTAAANSLSLYIPPRNGSSR